MDHSPTKGYTMTANDLIHFLCLHVGYPSPLQPRAATTSCAHLIGLGLFDGIAMTDKGVAFCATLKATPLPVLTPIEPWTIPVETTMTRGTPWHRALYPEPSSRPIGGGFYAPPVAPVAQPATLNRDDAETMAENLKALAEALRWLTTLLGSPHVGWVPDQKQAAESARRVGKTAWLDLEQRHWQATH